VIHKDSFILDYSEYIPIRCNFIEGFSTPKLLNSQYISSSTQQNIWRSMNYLQRLQSNIRSLVMNGVPLENSWAFETLE
jgi:hypothetical protein